MYFFSFALLTVFFLYPVFSTTSRMSVRSSSPDPEAEDAQLRRRGRGGGSEDGDDEEGGAASEQRWTDDINWEVPNNFISAVDKEISVDSLEFDTTLECGQIRALSDKMMKETVAAMRSNPMNELLRCVCWPRRLGSSTYVVLGGQHSVAAIKQLRQEYLERSLPPPECYQKVLAKVLLFETPLDLRQRMAGDHQCAQGTVHPVPMWRLVAFLVDALKHTGDPDKALATAIQKSGKQRPRTWGDLKEKWGPLLVLAQTMQESAVVAIRNLEENTPAGLTPNTFRPLRQLYTPQHRAMACRVLEEPRPTVKTWMDGVNAAARAQWVDFHWRSDNPRIDPDKGILRPAFHPFYSFWNVITFA